MTVLITGEKGQGTRPILCEEHHMQLHFRSESYPEGALCGAACRPSRLLRAPSSEAQTEQHDSVVLPRDTCVSQYDARSGELMSFFYLIETAFMRPCGTVAIATRSPLPPPIDRLVLSVRQLHAIFPLLR